MINGKTDRKRENLTESKSGSSVKADCHHALPVYPHLMRLFGNTMTPLINVFHFKSACLKHSSNNLICRSTPGFPMYHKRFGHSNVKKKKKKIQSHVWSPWSHIANLVQYYVGIHVSSKAFLRLYLAVISVATILIRLEIFIVSHDIQQLLANYLRLFLENVVQLLSFNLQLKL